MVSARLWEHEQERTAITFRALWRPVLALEAWAGRVDTQMTDMSWAGYDDHRLVHDMLLQEIALQRKPQEMRGRVTTLEQERDRRVDTQMTDMSWAGYDDHRLVHDMLLQEIALQRKPQEMRGRVTTLEQERDRKGR
uniref:Uncharacterized protein n=1 Tax=Tanacetum cinerariifolium TaxID=118510 RepID=A0A699I6P7_TANCI|nr:hypothetical protein [Tanacetum cinerariifolium]